MRGHSEQPKVRRTGLSFRLWGDPELELFPVGLSEPALRPLAARWTGPDQVEILPAAAELPEVRNEEYLARIPPGGEVAGLVVKRLPSNRRRLVELDFFRLPLPEGFPASGAGTFARPGGEGNRGVFRIDPHGRFLYLLYYPESQRTQESVALHRVRRPAAERPPGG